MANAICLCLAIVRVRVRVEKAGSQTHTELQSPAVNACDARRIKLDFYCHRYYID